ncbi:MAG: 4Fe-4S dicluster domain-containing protein [Candidatus Lokiarchaeota archaeon]|nr:4Fe-4S dicluster domain-containing protein [Candidatus Lokiarchaeota archaeon]
MSQSKFFELKEKIIETGKCTSCGTCVAVCPAHCLELHDLKPNMIDSKESSEVNECLECNLCLNFCPRSSYNMEFTEKYDPKISLGNTFSARTNDKEIKARCQDGGIVTTIIKFLFDEKLIDGALVSKFNKDWKPEPIIIQNKEELKSSSGTRYNISPNVSILTLKHLIEDLDLPYGDVNKLRIAFVGTPCQILAIKKLQSYKTNSQIFPSNVIKYTIGLFCMENFQYDKIMEEFVSKKLKISIDSLKRMNISKGKLLIQIDGNDEPISVAVKELDPYTNSACHYCVDFSNLYADISVGSIGSKSGYSTIIVRNKKGREIFERALKKDYFKTIQLTQKDLDSIRVLENIKKNKIKN